MWGIASHAVGESLHFCESHEKHSFTYVLPVGYVKLSPYKFCQHFKFWFKYL